MVVWNLLGRACLCSLGGKLEIGTVVVVVVTADADVDADLDAAEGLVLGGGWWVIIYPVLNLYVGLTSTGTDTCSTLYR